jgi:hypothetical protein
MICYYKIFLIEYILNYIINKNTGLRQFISIIKIQENNSLLFK